MNKHISNTIRVFIVYIIPTCIHITVLRSTTEEGYYDADPIS